MATSTREDERLQRWAAANSSPTEVTLFLSCLTEGCTKSVLMEWMGNRGCMEGCDYVHVPRNFQTGACLGFAFANFVNPASAQKLSWSARGTAMRVGVASEQGLANNLTKWFLGRVRQARQIRDAENMPFVRGLDVTGMKNPIRALEEMGVMSPIAPESRDRGPAVEKVPIPSFRPRQAAVGNVPCHAFLGGRRDATRRGGVAAVGRPADPQVTCPIVPAGSSFSEGVVLRLSL
jgi:hypothetical protein